MHVLVPLLSRNAPLRAGPENALLERGREERARAAVAEERGRIARELHDVIAPCVSVIVMQAGRPRRSLSGSRRGLVRLCARSGRVGNNALADMRRLLGVFRVDGDELAEDPQLSTRIGGCTDPTTARSGIGAVPREER